MYGVAKLCGIKVSPNDVESSILRRSPKADLSALNLKQLREALEELGLAAQTFKTQPETLSTIPTPSIAYFRPERINRKDGVGHVVIVTSFTDSSVRVLDLTQSREPIDIPVAEFSEGWDGEYLAVYRDSRKSTPELMSASVRRILWLSLVAISLVVFVFSIRHRPR